MEGAKSEQEFPAARRAKFRRGVLAPLLRSRTR